MRRATLVLLAVVTYAVAGCHHNTCHNGCGYSHASFGRGEGAILGGHRSYGGGCGPGGCNTCNDGGYGGRHVLHGHHHGAHKPVHVTKLPHGYVHDQRDGTGAPPTGTYAYPYYTTRAPRDFLLNNPPTIGP